MFDVRRGEKTFVEVPTLMTSCDIVFSMRVMYCDLIG